MLYIFADVHVHFHLSPIVNLLRYAYYGLFNNAVGSSDFASDDMLINY
jgi:hypothetical protein